MKEAAEQRQGLGDGQLIGELRVLQLNAEPLPQRAGVVLPREAQHLHFTRIRLRQAFADLDGGRLAGAVRPEQPKAFARAHVKVDAVDRDDVLKRLPELPDLQSHELSIVAYEVVTTGNDRDDR